MISDPLERLAAVYGLAPDQLIAEVDHHGSITVVVERLGDRAYLARYLDGLPGLQAFVLGVAAGREREREGVI